MSGEFDLRGKDYLTEAEAAHYSCVSQRQFRKKAREYGIMPTHFMGRVVYRRADIARAIENGYVSVKFG